MANLAVYIELGPGQEPTLASAFALAEARRISRCLGATVYAVVTPRSIAAREMENLALVLGQLGADRVLMSHHTTAVDFATYISHGSLLEAIAAKLRPRLFIFPAGTSAVHLAPSLSARLLAEFFPHAAVRVTPTNAQTVEGGRLDLKRIRADGKVIEVLDVLDTDRPVVCTLTTNANFVSSKVSDAELELISLPPAAYRAPLQIEARRRNFSDCHTVLVAERQPLHEEAPGLLVVSPEDAQQVLGLICPQHVVFALEDVQASSPPVVVVDAGLSLAVCSLHKPHLKAWQPRVFWQEDVRTATQALCETYEAQEPAAS